MINDRVISDQELIRQFINGDHSSLEDLVKRHQRKVFSYILLIVKDKHLAEDIFQDTFIKVINTLRAGAYNEEGKFLPWVMRIATTSLSISSVSRSACPLSKTARNTTCLKPSRYMRKPLKTN
jgi:DNA-directed RNA polymerase specialized sigma24 family protein